MNMTKACIPLMKKENKGKIVNIISVDALEGKSERSLYVSTKWAQAGFTNSMRKELEKYNIAVIGIYPGLMNTSLFKNAGKEKDLSNAMDPKEAARIIEFTLSLDNIVLEQVVFRNLHF
jgi:short-subunit dehydrogenase